MKFLFKPRAESVALKPEGVRKPSRPSIVIGRHQNLLICAVCIMTLGIAISAPRTVRAQTLDVMVDTSVGTGVTLVKGASDDTRRTPLFIDVDAAFVFDGDDRSEWVLGLMTQVEERTAVAPVAQVRLFRGQRPWNYYAGIGVPIFVHPYVQTGVELEGGVIYALDDPFALVATLRLANFFAGEGLPDDATVTMLNMGFGARVRF